jgi:D-alanyl-D-alanine dipeptidase
VREDPIVLISDPRIIAIPIEESHEECVDLLSESSGLMVDISRSQIDSRSTAFATARRTVAQKLVQAQQSLPHGLHLFIKEAYRPLSIQQASFENYAATLQKAHLEWTVEQVNQEACKYVAPVAVAPHSTGGAVDLTLIDAEGMEVDMGTPFNASPFFTQQATYTNASNISAEARAYRNLLRQALQSVGFVNYPTEWWHWSYGERYWAFVTGSAHAIYGGVLSV